LQHDAANVSAHTLGCHIKFCIAAWNWLQQLERTINMMSMQQRCAGLPGM